jgi:paraquat-inducible protein B
MPEPDTRPPQVPESKVYSRKRTRLSLVWIIPIVAAAVGGWVAVTRILGQGPEITIVFKSAEGLEAGKTKIHYNGVDIGTLTTIRLSDDHQHVITTAQMAPKTESFFVKDTNFWIVSPRISGATVTGLGTLISGSYIGMEIGRSKEPKRDFVALETPPVVTGEVPGRFFSLQTPNLGSLDRGTPIYFRRLQVGQVAAYALDKDGQSFTVKVFVKAPYDQYVTQNTRFWQASGIDLSLSASGLSVQTQSLLSILIGGIAFETPATGPVLPEAEADTVFTLFSDRAEAFKPGARYPQTYLLVFKQSVRGLEPGAPVDFQGIPVGEVVDVRAQVDTKTFRFSVPVTIRLDPQRLGVNVLGLKPGENLDAIRKKLVDALVAHGARAQLQTGNLLTGSLFVAIGFFPDAPPATVDWSKKPAELPTVPSDIQAIEASVVGILKKLDQIPYKAIGEDVQSLLKKLDQVSYKALGDDLQKSLAELDRTLVSARTLVNDADTFVRPNSVMSESINNTLEEVNRAVRDLRVLADYLSRHPDALIRGKPGEAK